MERDTARSQYFADGWSLRIDRESTERGASSDSDAPQSPHRGHGSARSVLPSREPNQSGNFEFHRRGLGHSADAHSLGKLPKRISDCEWRRSHHSGIAGRKPQWAGAYLDKFIRQSLASATTGEHAAV